MSLFSFNVWADEEMTVPFGVMKNGKTGVELTHIDGGAVRFSFFFGSKSSSTKLINQDNPANGIQFVINQVLPHWKPEQQYKAGELMQPSPNNGYVYKAKTDGKSQQEQPKLGNVVGAEYSDGGLKWLCVGQKHNTNEVKLALSEDGLASAGYGDNLLIVNEMPSGVAVKVYAEVRNLVTNIYNSNLTPQLNISLNDGIFEVEN